MLKLLTRGLIFGSGFWLGGAVVLVLAGHAMSYDGNLTLNEIVYCFAWPIEAYKYLVL